MKTGRYKSRALMDLLVRDLLCFCFEAQNIFMRCVTGLRQMWQVVSSFAQAAQARCPHPNDVSLPALAIASSQSEDILFLFA